MTKNTQAGQTPEWTIADRLRKARELTGMKQNEFADEIGISRGTVSNYERGLGPFKRPYLLAWALGAGVPLEWLTNTESPPKTPQTKERTAQAA